MNCHKNTNEKQTQDEHKHNPMKHMLMMLLCCGLPIILVLLVPFLGIFGEKFKLTVSSIIPFLCPIMMLFMMHMMMKSSRNGKSCCSEKKNNTTSSGSNSDI